MSWEREYVRDVQRAAAERLDAEIAAAAGGATPRPVYPECQLEEGFDTLQDPELVLVCMACRVEVACWPMAGPLPTVSDLQDKRTEHGAAEHPGGVL